MMNMERDISIFAVDEIELPFPRERVQGKNMVCREVFRIGIIQGKRGCS